MKIAIFNLKTLHSNKGFTIVEALVSVAILAVIGIAMANLLNQSFQINTKSQLISRIKQNGQNALFIMEETIRDIDKIDCIDGTGRLLVVKKNGTFIRFSINPEVSGSKNGYIGQETFTVKDDYCLNTTPSNLLKITDDSDVFSGVSLKSGNFAYVSASTKDAVIIKFGLGAAVKAPANFYSKINNVNFQTTVGIRQR